MSGVRSLLVADLWGNGVEEIVAGRPGTVEFRGLDGSLLGRAATEWGTDSALALLAKGPAGPLLLAGKENAGKAQLSGIGKKRTTVANDLFTRIPSGFTDMHSWLERGTSGLRVADLDGDGREEVVTTISGSWNELRVYDAGGNPRWVRYFGPEKVRGAQPFMSGLEVVDLDGDGRMEIVTSTRDGWVLAFDSGGTVMWRRRFPSSVTSLAARGAPGGAVAVGCGDGTEVLLDRSGETVAKGRMEGEVTAEVMTEGGFVVGDATGLVRKYPLPGIRLQGSEKEPR
jgi:hypothetical protein